MCFAKLVQVKLRRILRVYEKASGQKVNLEKSSVFMSRDTDQRTKDSILSTLEGIKYVNQVKYLGMPMVIGKDKSNTFGYIRDRIKERVRSWKSKLPKGLCKEISGVMGRFWCGGDEERRKMHWMKWSKLSEAKGNGGLGFRDLQNFNTALLAKQVWRILTNPNLLASKVLKARYFPNSSIFGAKRRALGSWISQSLSSAILVLEKHCRRRIGDGHTVKIWEDRWLGKGTESKIRTRKPVDCERNLVEDLIQNNQWNEARIKQIFVHEDVEEILTIPLSRFKVKDRWFWPSTRNGEYSIGYAKAKKDTESSQSSSGGVHESRRRGREAKIWKKLWGLNIKQKIKHFI